VKMHWISYGAGVNSTALMIAAINSTIDIKPFRVVFCDTQDEKDETYEYLYRHAMPYARTRGVTIEVCRGVEGVLETWERLSVTGSRIIRSCTTKAKIVPFRKHVTAHTPEGFEPINTIGIHADEEHRAKEARDGELKRRFPLIELDWGHDECVAAIVRAGLPVPVKSGCWHCPFMRKSEIIQLAVTAPCKFERIIKLEDAANEKHPGHLRTQWGDKPAREIRDGGALFADASKDLPCACWDGDAESKV